jgi:hypothetical protein
MTACSAKFNRNSTTPTPQSVRQHRQWDLRHRRWHRALAVRGDQLEHGVGHVVQIAANRDVAQRRPGAGSYKKMWQGCIISLTSTTVSAMIVGEPMDLSAYREREVDGELLREVTEVIMTRVRELLKEVRNT